MCHRERCKGCPTYNQEWKEMWKLLKWVRWSKCGRQSMMRTCRQAGSEKCPGVWGNETASSVIYTQHINQITGCLNTLRSSRYYPNKSGNPGLERWAVKGHATSRQQSHWWSMSYTTSMGFCYVNQRAEVTLCCKDVGTMPRSTQ